MSSIKEVHISGKTLAELLGLTPSGVTRATSAGTFSKTPGGGYVLGEAVLAYCQKLRGAKKADNLEEAKLELLRKQIALADQKLRDERVEYGIKVATAIISQIADVIDGIGEAAKGNEELMRAVDNAISAVGAVEPQEVIADIASAGTSEAPEQEGENGE